MSDDENWGELKPRNRRGWHLNNVDVQVMVYGTEAVMVKVSAIIDDPVNGAPYEATGMKLIDVVIPRDGTKLNPESATNMGTTVERSWLHWYDGQLEEEGHVFGDSTLDMVSRCAELGLKIVNKEW